MGSHLHSGEAWDYIFILGVCPTTEGEYTLSAAGLVSPGEDHRVSAGIFTDFGLLCFFLPIGRKLNQFQPE